MKNHYKSPFLSKSLYLTLLCLFHRGLADTKQTGKLNREQFSLAMYLIQQKVTKDIDPPSTLTPDMIPPSERTATGSVSAFVLNMVHFTFLLLNAIKKEH